LNKIKSNKTKQTEYQITPQGSLGILASGDIGLRAWRKVKNTEPEKASKDE
jgi:hypothetical protein